MIIWSELFATHIELVDSQHKKLFELLNDLSEKYNSTGPDEPSINKALEALIAYSEKHFTEEEQLMMDSKLDERHIKIHQMEHKSFIYDVSNMCNYFSTDEELLTVTEKLVCFGTSWLTYHILGTDPVMAAQIFAIQNGATPEKAYELHSTIKYNAIVTRMMLDSVLDLWRTSAERCLKLETKLAALTATHA